MARTVDAILRQYLAFLPPPYESATPLLAAFARALRDGEVTADDLVALVSFGGAEEIWLTLHAQGYGLLRGVNETDPALRIRLRNVDERLTRPSILAAVNALLAPFTAIPAIMIEWFEEPYLDIDETVPGTSGGFYLDSTFISGGRNSFILLVPRINDSQIAGGDGLDVDFFLDSSFLGSDSEDPVYAAIINEVERLRAAGIRWALVLVD